MTSAPNNMQMLAQQLGCHRNTLTNRLRPHRDKLLATGWRPGDKVLFPETLTVIYDVLRRPRA